MAMPPFFASNWKVISGCAPSRALFPYAELFENHIEHIVGGGFTDNVTQMVQGGLEFDGQQIGGQFPVKSAKNPGGSRLRPSQ
jgi:hypothetical protein